MGFYSSSPCNRLLPLVGMYRASPCDGWRRLRLNQSWTPPPALWNADSATQPIKLAPCLNRTGSFSHHSAEQCSTRLHPLVRSLSLSPRAAPSVVSLGRCMDSKLLTLILLDTSHKHFLVMWVACIKCWYPVSAGSNLVHLTSPCSFQITSTAMNGSSLLQFSAQKLQLLLICWTPSSSAPCSTCCMS